MVHWLQVNDHDLENTSTQCAWVCPRWLLLIRHVHPECHVMQDQCRVPQPTMGEPRIPPQPRIPSRAHVARAYIKALPPRTRTMTRRVQVRWCSWQRTSSVHVHACVSLAWWQLVLWVLENATLRCLACDRQVRVLLADGARGEDAEDKDQCKH